MAARLAVDGWTLVDDPALADAVLVNTCGFVAAAKKDSIDTILAAADTRADGTAPTVVAVGCLAERYGAELAEALPEAAAVLGFDDYPEIGERLRRVVAGEHLPAHQPSDRRRLLPISPVERQASAGTVPGHDTMGRDLAGLGDDEAQPGGWRPPVLRRRLDGSPVAPVKLASGCDRRCTFCAIPSFRGAFVSRPPEDVLAEISWLVGEGVREVVLVSENSTSYGKDLGDLRMLEGLLPRIAETGVRRARIAYLQPAEVRPDLLVAMAAEPVIAPYFDLSFQHGSPTVLRRMRRFGGRQEFLDLIGRVRGLVPEAGIRSNVIVGFPGETEEEFEDLLGFLVDARLDAVGVFGYSDEDGTEAESLPGKVAEDEVRARVERATALAEEVMAQRAEDRVGEQVTVLVEAIEDDDAVAVGRAGHQGPDDGMTTVLLGDLRVRVGDLVHARVVGTDGVDLVAEPAPGARTPAG
jgi:ribosomal protein S12 methylthiotransferase RimO